MKRTITISLALIVGILLTNASTPARAAGWGNLKGKFVFDGAVPDPIKLNITKDTEFCGKHELVDEALVVGAEGGLANVLIYVRSKEVDVHPDFEATKKDTVRMDIKNCRFEPHLLTIRVGQTLKVRNSDPKVAHNANMQPLGDKGISPNIVKDPEYKFGKAQTLPIPVVCNIHPWMKGWVLPRDNPYMAVSAEDGSFEIKNLPAGKLEFQVWQEKAGYLEAMHDWKRGRFEMTIEEGDNDLGVIKVDPKLFDE